MEFGDVREGAIRRRVVWTVSISSLVAGSGRNVVGALHEALSARGDRRDEQPAGAVHLFGTTRASIARLRILGSAAQTLTETLAHVLAVQAYTFDPDYTPIRSDELE
jgi:hypothetical protein